MATSFHRLNEIDHASWRHLYVPIKHLRMAKTHHTASKEMKQKRVKKKRKKSHVHSSHDALSGVCNITGLDTVGGFGSTGLDGTYGGLQQDNVMDCLDAMATAQVGSSSLGDDIGESIKQHVSKAASSLSTQSPSNPSPPEPPGIHQIPNIRIELARHLQTQTLSTYLLQSCPGLRMPTFERWLLDSKLEETDRFDAIIEEWLDNPGTKLVHTDGKVKKKYGRAAKYEQRDGDAQYEREKARKERECKLLLGAEKRIPPQSKSNDTTERVGKLIRHVERDPILPSNSGD